MQQVTTVISALEVKRQILCASGTLCFLLGYFLCFCVFFGPLLCCTIVFGPTAISGSIFSFAQASYHEDLQKEFQSVADSWTGINRPTQAALQSNYDLLPTAFQKYLKKTLNLTPGSATNFLPVWIDNALISSSGDIIVFPLVFLPIKITVKGTQIFSMNTEADKLLNYSFFWEGRNEILPPFVWISSIEKYTSSIGQSRTSVMGMYNLEQYASVMSNFIKFFSEVPSYAPNFFLTSPNSPSIELWEMANSTSLFHVRTIDTAATEAHDIVEVYFKKDYGVKRTSQNSAVLTFHIDKATSTLYELKGTTLIEEYEKMVSRYFVIRFDGYQTHEILGHNFYLPNRLSVKISQDGTNFVEIENASVDDIKVQAQKA